MNVVPEEVVYVESETVALQEKAAIPVVPLVTPDGVGRLLCVVETIAAVEGEEVEVGVLDVRAGAPLLLLKCQKSS